MELVVAAFENERQCRQMKELLEGGGVTCLVCRSGAQVRRALTTHQVYCVVCGVRLTDGLAEWLYEDFPPACSLLLVGPKHQLELCALSEAVKLATPLDKGELLSTVRLMIQFGRKVERLLRTRRGPAEQETVPRAKALLMKCRGLSEEEAHRTLQKRSMDSGCRLEQAARRILAELEREFSPPPGG